MSSFEDYFYKGIAGKIREIRIEKGLTQEKLSEMLSKNEKYIGHIERCERKMSNTMIIKLLDLWKLQPNDFFNFPNPYIWKN